MYVCGITPYDATHMGHAATYVAFDLLNRAWRNAGHDVTYVQNVTDVDDPLLERADRRRGWTGVTSPRARPSCSGRTWPRCGSSRPPHFPGAVESIPLIVAMIERLQVAGARLRRGRRPLLLRGTPIRRSARSPAGPGEQMLEIFADRGGDPDRPGKKDPLDCLVWRAERPGEPAWDSPFGPGRPGWHVECSAIALDLLGDGFDVQGGGSDLVFPHHEMCASEAQVLTGTPFAQAYVHAGMVGLDGEKMSKSRGNLVLVSALRNSDVDPMAIRLALLRHHYRSDWEWTETELWASARPARPLAERRSARGRVARRLRWWTRCWRPWPPTSTRRPPWPSSTPGPTRPSAPTGRATSATPTAGATVRALLDAALGLAL